MTSFWLPIGSLWWREIIRFVRQRSRLLGAFAQPFVFWLLLGAGMRESFRPSAGTGGTNFAEYFFPGVIVMVLLFTAIFATISTVDDRHSGFLQGVLVAPVSRAQIVLGQAAGGTTLAVLQGGLFLIIAPIAGIPLSLGSFALGVVVMSVVAFALTNLGLVIAWRSESTQGFHAIMNLILMPIWFLSGAFFPAAGAPSWLGWVIRANPLTYGTAALRRALYWQNPAAVSALPGLAISLAVSLAFAALSFAAAVEVSRRSRQ
ncbi:MAG: type transport system permease protein [Candidatus Binatota bacterium]|nr:type transport system permease protein [Candidatus Binatota bacterium]